MKALKNLAEKFGIIKKEEAPLPEPITDQFLKDKALKYLYDDEYNVKIEFIKKDGTTRWILCTLAENLIPVKSRPKKDSTVEFTTEVCRVYDLEKMAWRSFRWNSVKSVDIRLAEEERFNNSTTVESEPENAII